MAIKPGEATWFGSMGSRGGFGAEAPRDTGGQAWPRWGPGLTVRQVSRQVWHHIAADQLPPKVIVLTLAVLALVRVAVLLEGAAGCGESNPSAPAEQLVPPQNPAGWGTPPPKHRGTPSIPPRAPVRNDMVLPAANPPSLPFSSPTSETSWQVSAPGKSQPQEQDADAAPSFASQGLVTKLGGFSQETGT